MVSGSNAEGTESSSERDRSRHEVKPLRKVLDVRIVEPRGEAIVVEVKTQKDWYRSVLPASLVKKLPGTDKAVAFEDDLKAGAYGEDWQKMVDAKDFPQRLAQYLHEQGIFSFAELHKNLNNARVAVQSAHGRTLADLLSKEK